MRFAVVGALLTAVVGQLQAQTAATTPIEDARFEAISIKPVPSGSNIAGYRPDATRFHGWLTVGELLNLAYQLKAHRIADAPSWVTNDRYEVTAAISAPRQKGDLPFMLRHLLADRFAVKAHHEHRPLPVYVLRVARSDGKLGPGLIRVNRTCSNDTAAAQADRCYGSYGIGEYRFTGWKWEDVPTALELFSGRSVIDRTGLSGQFDLTLEWNPNINRVPDFIVNGPTLAELEARPALFTAVQEQLGLKLEPGTEPLEVLVIDKVERPLPD